MPARCTISSSATIDRVMRELKSMKGRKILIGPNCRDGSQLAKIAGANEYGAVIKAKSGWLAIPLAVEAKGHRPADFADLFFVPGSTKGHGFLAYKTGRGQIKRLFILKKQIVIPERSFLRGTFDKRETHDKAVRIMDDMVRRIIAGTATATDVLNAIGASHVSSVKQRMASSIDPKNSALTIMLKGSGKGTLIDEAHLLKSITYEVA